MPGCAPCPAASSRPLTAPGDEVLVVLTAARPPGSGPARRKALAHDCLVAARAGGRPARSKTNVPCTPPAVREPSIPPKPRSWANDILDPRPVRPVASRRLQRVEHLNENAPAHRMQRPPAGRVPHQRAVHLRGYYVTLHCVRLEHAAHLASSPLHALLLETESLCQMPTPFFAFAPLPAGTYSAAGRALGPSQPVHAVRGPRPPAELAQSCRRRVHARCLLAGDHGRASTYVQ